MYIERIRKKTLVSIKNSILFSIVISIFAQIYLHPFDSSFVLGIGVVTIGYIFSVSENIYPFLIGVISGGLIVGIRITNVLIFGDSHTYSLTSYIPAFVFYITYGALGSIFPLKKKDKSIFYLFFYLVLFDITSNFIEILVRGMVSISTIRLIIITAIIRGIIQCIVFLVYKYNKLYIEKIEHQKRYAMLNLMVSKLYAEAFYLQKSTNDLNSIMKEAYKLYDTNKDNLEISTKALEIAQNVHEIRKNNDRVLKGINQLVDNVGKTEYMLISEIFAIISDNTKRQIKEINSNIYIEFKLIGDYLTERYYDIFSILNNLIINSIEACDSNNIITVKGEITDKELIFIIEDNGEGIDEDIIPYIFNPGFSTKFNKETGEMSTGIGLCHAKNLIEALGGSIKVKSELNGGSSFTATMPI